MNFQGSQKQKNKVPAGKKFRAGAEFGIKDIIVIEIKKQNPKRHFPRFLRSLKFFNFYSDARYTFCNSPGIGRSRYGSDNPVCKYQEIPFPKKS